MGFDQPIEIPIGFAQVLDATLKFVAPQVFLDVALQVALKFIGQHRRFNGIDALQATVGVVAWRVDRISIRQELARNQGWDQRSPRGTHLQLIPSAQHRDGTG